MISYLVVSALHYILIILALVIYLGYIRQLPTRSCYTQISCANGMLCYSIIDGLCIMEIITSLKIWGRMLGRTLLKVECQDL